MIKKILLFSAVAISSLAYAQNLDLQTTTNNSIDGGTHYFFDSGALLAETKLHVANSSGSAIEFDVMMREISNGPASDWQVCFGTACYVANNSTSFPQQYSAATAPAGGTYNDLKIAPFSFGWSNGDFGVWRVMVFDTTNTADSSSAYVYWEANGKPAGDQNANTLIDGNEIAGDINENGVIDGNEIPGDMNGDGIINVWEVGGDENGNGIIDGNENPLSVNDLDFNKVQMAAYPNPANNEITISYDIQENNAIAPRVDVIDVVGKNVSTLYLMNNKGIETFDVSNLNSGVYFFTIKVGNQALKTERVIIK